MKLKRRLGDILIELKYINKLDLRKALEMQKVTGKKLGEIFIENKMITEEELLNVLKEQLSIPIINLRDVLVDREAVITVPEYLAKKYTLIPIGFEGDKLLIIMHDPLNIIAQEDVAIASGHKINVALCKKKEIREAISKYYSESYMKKTAEEYRANDIHEKEIESELEIDEIKNSPAVKMVDSIIESAVKSRVSDIHIEPFDSKFTVRYRIDGQLYKQFDSPKEPLGTIVTRLKIMGNMDIAERRTPQDGRIITEIDGEMIDLRVSVLPTVNGEKIVLRILDKEAFNVNKHDLGMRDDDLKKLNDVIKNPYGIVLVTGPTGSGKTTTLYSVLKDLNSEDKNIVTVEDPVECSMEGINQVGVNLKAGLDFATGLRSILRQDPDIIMVGEIRDSETAEIAIRAAITGHLVLSTIHTNDAPSSIVRLKDMDIAPYLVASSLVGVVAQRLIRKLCPHCKEKVLANDYEKDILGIDRRKNITIYKKVGCNKCNNNGYKGRVGVYEIMKISNNIRNLIYEDKTAEDIRKVAIREGMKTIRESAIDVVLDGNSTIEEILRIILLGD